MTVRGGLKCVHDGATLVADFFGKLIVPEQGREMCAMLKKILCAAGVVVMMAVSSAEAAKLDAARVSIVRAEADSGKASSQCVMGECYGISGLCEGVPQNYTKAREWLEKAAAQGDAEAQYNLGIMYDNGQGVRQNYAKAREWYEKAAAQGNVEAQYNLGCLYNNGQGVRQNKATAKEWFGKACDNGDQNGCDAYRKLNEAGY